MTTDESNPSRIEPTKPLDFQEVGYLLRAAVEGAARGEKLGRNERSALSDYLNGTEWFSKRPSRFSDDAKMARAQIVLLGRDLRRALDRISKGGELSKDERRELQLWLSNARLMRVRNQLRRLLYLVGYSGFLILGVLFYKPGFSVLNANPLWIPFIISVAILLAALAKDIFLERNITIALRQIIWTVERGTENLEGFLEETLEPRISPLESRERVRREATKIFDEVIKEGGDDRVVLLMGAASLGTPKKDEPRDLDEDKMGSVEEYNAKLTQMQNAGISIKRYVSLIKPNDSPPARRSKTQQEYVDWLSKQIEILDNNPKYTLIDCHRAQPWGGSRSSILTSKAFLDLVGDGESGFLIKGERISELLNQSSKKVLDAASQRTYQGGKKEDIAALREIKTALDTTMRRESRK